MPDQSPLRNQPKQARSRQRITLILDTAEKLFTQRGFDAVTTNHIAVEAGVSVGSLYRFFANKDVILEALIERYTQAMREELPQVDTAVPIRQMVQALIANILHFEQAYSAFPQILAAAPGGSLAAHNTDMQKAMVAYVDAMLAAYYPALDAQARNVCATAGFGIVKGMMTLHKPPAALPKDTIAQEIVAVLMAYLRDFLPRHGVDVSDETSCDDVHQSS